MRIVVVAVGRVRPPFADDVAHYAQLLSGHARLDLVEVREDDQLPRRIEARADAYALELTDAPEPFIGFERRITVKNVSEPDPPDWAELVFGTHPTTLERIGAAVAFRESGPRADRRTPAGS